MQLLRLLFMLFRCCFCGSFLRVISLQQSRYLLLMDLPALPISSIRWAVESKLSLAKATGPKRAMKTTPKKFIAVMLKLRIRTTRYAWLDVSRRQWIHDNMFRHSKFKRSSVIHTTITYNNLQAPCKKIMKPLWLHWTAEFESDNCSTRFYSSEGIGDP